MAITNPFSIVYGSRTVGGADDNYLLNGPYALSLTFGEFQLSFEVVVTAESHADLKTLSSALETDFRKRDQSITISLDGNNFVYTSGTTILNVTSEIAKSASSDTDRGNSRAYSVSITGTLPADDNDGLQDVGVSVSYTPSRQKSVTFTGSYTPSGGNTATEQYLADFDAEAAAMLTSIDGSATWELIDENYEQDRNDHSCPFTRTYVEILAEQTTGVLNAVDIRDHRMTFTEQESHPGDSAPDVYRLRRVAGTYDCSVDIDQTTDMQSVYQEQVRDHVLALFVANFDPQVYCVEDRRVAYDETAKKMSVAITFLYQPTGGNETVEVTSSTTTREITQPDYTPVHEPGRFAMDVDYGFATKQRIKTFSSISIGDYDPGKTNNSARTSLGESGPGGRGLGGVGTSTNPVRTTRVGADPGSGGGGWTKIEETIQTTPQYIGHPDEEQIEIYLTNGTVVEQYHDAPRYTG